MTDFILDTGNNGWIIPAPTSGTGNTHTTLTVDTLNFNPQTAGPAGGSFKKGSLVILGGGGHAPDILASVASSTSITLLTATSSTLTGTSVEIFQNPVLIGGEASALTNGSAVLSSYWNNTGIFTQADFAQAPYYDIWFESGGAFTPTGGGTIQGWFIPSFDGGTTFESDAIATPSTTVPALSRSPDFIIPLDAAAYAAGNIRWCQGLVTSDPPSTPFKIKVQNWAGVTMPSTWSICAGPRALKY